MHTVRPGEYSTFCGGSCAPEKRIGCWSQYNEGDWGCGTGAPAKNGASSNSYIRFHWTGALELSLMVLDHFDATG